MSEIRKNDIEVVTESAREQLPPPSSVSKAALSSAKVIVATESGPRKVDFSVVPSERSLHGTEDRARLDGAHLQIEVVQNFLRRIFRGGRYARWFEYSMVHPDESEAARPQLVVREQKRIALGNSDYAYMGDGQRMTVDGERPLVDEFVERHPDSFPAVA